MLYRILYPSPLGDLTVTCNEAYILELILPGQVSRCSDAISSEAVPILKVVRRWLDAYFSGKQPHPSLLPLQPPGSSFQLGIWQLLLSIPYGQTVTYGQLAAEYARRHNLAKMSAQAVGQAVGRNPISIIVPCHRVVGANGSLTGYNGGLENKRWLLNHEQT